MKRTNETRFVIFGSYKGGVGKSTLTAATALSLAREAYEVAILDWDPNDSSSRFLDTHSDVDHLHTFNPRKINDYDFVLIDTPGNVKELEQAKSYIVEADSFVIVADSSIDSVHAAANVCKLLKKYGVLERASVVVNKVATNTKNAEKANDVLESFKEVYGLEGTTMPFSVSFQYAKEETVGYSAISPRGKAYLGDLLELAVTYTAE